MKPLPVEKCPQCGRIASHWYDERDAHMVEEFKAGTTTTRLADVYRLSQQRVTEIIVNKLGMEAMWRIVRAHAHNEEEE